MRYVLPFFIGLMMSVVGIVGHSRIPRLSGTFSWVVGIGVIVMLVTIIILMINVIRKYGEDYGA